MFPGIKTKNRSMSERTDVMHHQIYSVEDSRGVLW